MDTNELDQEQLNHLKQFMGDLMDHDPGCEFKFGMVSVGKDNGKMQSVELTFKLMKKIVKDLG